MATKYKSLVNRVTALPNGVTLVPNTEFETEVDLSAWEKVGFVKKLGGEKKEEKKVEEKESPKRGSGRSSKNS